MEVGQAVGLVVEDGVRGLDERVVGRVEDLKWSKVGSGDITVDSVGVSQRAA